MLQHIFHVIVARLKTRFIHCFRKAVQAVVISAKYLFHISILCIYLG